MKITIKTVLIISSFFILNKPLIAQSCDGDNLNLTSMTKVTNHAKTSITSSAVIENGNNIIFKAGSTITLTHGFHAKAGSQFTASIADCSDGPIVAEACTAPNTTIWNNPWLSCQTTINPNTSRGASHWIRYDLGGTYKLRKMQVWNVNKIGESNKGFKEVVIDYSLNGTSWTQLGNYQFAQGTEAAVYAGVEAANFNGLSARYVLITAISNWGNGSCSGISDVKFNIAPTLLQDASAMLVARNSDEWFNLNSQKMLEKTNANFLVYPNPTSHATNLLLENETDVSATIIINDVTGRLIYSIPVEVVTGRNDWTLSLENIPSGTYFVNVLAEEKSLFETQKLVIVKE